MKFNILDLLLPRETKFYTMLNKQSEMLLKSSQEFRQLVTNLQSGSHDAVLKSMITIKELEKSGNKTERALIDELDKTFITPLDREDINRIAMQMAIPLDLISDLSHKLEIYGIKQMPVSVSIFCDILVGICNENVALIGALESRKGIPEIIRLMHEFEKRGDDAFHQAMAKLFESNSPIEIIKFKEVYEVLEDIIDSVDDVGKIIRGIMIKLG